MRKKRSEERRAALRCAVRVMLFALLAALLLRTVSVTATARSFRAAAARARAEAAIPLALLRYEMGAAEEEALSGGASLALRLFPFLAEGESAVAEAWSSELQALPDDTPPAEDREGTVLTAPAREEEIPRGADNGIPARTLRASDPAGYTVLGSVYINNASVCVLDAQTLARADIAACPAEAPQVLIVHTHATEAYTMPAGEEYEPSDDHRTLDETKNMLRVGDEIARVLEDAGLGVLHDRTLCDYPKYSGAYDRSLAVIERARAQYPSLTYILDVHRDAVEDSAGNAYKLLSAEQPAAAQLELVVGSSGGGAEHPRWLENLRLACAVQETAAADCPTLMRPIIVRNSRYNQHVTPGSLLVEVGTAGNSLDEALAAARLFAEAFAKTVLAQREGA